MKKIIFSILFISAFGHVFAQSVKFGISGGLNESLLTLQNTTDNNNSSLTGFHAGVFSDIDFGKITLSPGLFYTTKGENNKVFVADPGGATFTANGKVTYNYLELPINILYNIPVGGGKFFAGGGPYLAYCLSGRTEGTITENSNGTITTTDVNAPLTVGSQNGEVKRVDFGLGALGGFELNNGLSISAGYEYGLTNTENSSSDISKNRVFMVSLGYCFL